MSGDVVPFGKYRGQPLEAMAADRQYVDWLMQQPWFRERYKGLYTIVINNFQEPSETPEHNALQVLFLDEEYRTAFVEATHPGWIKSRWDEYEEGLWKRFEKAEQDLLQSEQALQEAREEDAKEGIEYDSWSVRNAERNHGECKAKLEEKRCELDKTRSLIVVNEVGFEKRAVDVSLWIGIYSDIPRPRGVGVYDHNLLDCKEFPIEIKPTVGDDYPAVLRQMLASKTDYLFVQSYTGVGATLDQFRKIFNASGKTVVFRHEVEAILNANKAE